MYFILLTKSDTKEKVRVNIDLISYYEKQQKTTGTAIYISDHQQPLLVDESIDIVDQILGTRT